MQIMALPHCKGWYYWCPAFCYMRMYWWGSYGIVTIPLPTPSKKVPVSFFGNFTQQQSHQLHQIQGREEQDEISSYQFTSPEEHDDRKSLGTTVSSATVMDFGWSWTQHLYHVILKTKVTTVAYHNVGDKAIPLRFVFFDLFTRHSWSAFYHIGSEMWSQLWTKMCRSVIINASLREKRLREMKKWWTSKKVSSGKWFRHYRSSVFFVTTQRFFLWKKP